MRPLRGVHMSKVPFSCPQLDAQVQVYSAKHKRKSHYSKSKIEITDAVGRFYTEGQLL